MRASILFLIFVFFSKAIFALELTSSAFKDGGQIPSEYTCDSRDDSIPLFWKGIPQGVKSFVITCNDPDAPVGDWIHWIIFNIPGQKNSLPAGLPKAEILDDGSVQLKNDFDTFGYGGPCPPAGKAHRYFFKLYALDIILTNEEGTKESILKAIEGHIIAEAKLMGIYKH